MGLDGVSMRGCSISKRPLIHSYLRRTYPKGTSHHRSFIIKWVTLIVLVLPSECCIDTTLLHILRISTWGVSYANATLILRHFLFVEPRSRPSRIVHCCGHYHFQVPKFEAPSIVTKLLITIRCVLEQENCRAGQAIVKLNKPTC